MLSQTLITEEQQSTRADTKAQGARLHYQPACLPSSVGWFVGLRTSVSWAGLWDVWGGWGTCDMRRCAGTYMCPFMCTHLHTVHTGKNALVPRVAFFFSSFLTFLYCFFNLVCPFVISRVHCGSKVLGGGISLDTCSAEVRLALKLARVE